MQGRIHSVAHLTSVHRATDTRILRKECRTLARAGFDVTLVAPGPTDVGGDVDNVRIELVGEPRTRRERMTRTVKRVYRRARELDADLYHLHDPELLSAGLALRRSGKRVVYDAHEDVPRDVLSKDWLAAPVRRPLAWAVERAESFAARRMSGVVAATPTIEARLARLNPRTTVVNNYPILGDLSAPRAGATTERAVCYVGDINSVRGTIEMIDAAGIAGVRLLLGGTFSEAGLRERAKARPGWGQVEELGQLSRAEVAETLARSRAGLVLLHPEPNHVAGRPNKLFEYMSAGLPVIASDFPLWRELVADCGCGICVDPLAPERIAAAILALVDDPGRAAAMGAHGRELVETELNWEPEGRRLVEFYATLA